MNPFASLAALTTDVKHAKAHVFKLKNGFFNAGGSNARSKYVLFGGDVGLVNKSMDLIKEIGRRIVELKHFVSLSIGFLYPFVFP